MFKFESWLLRFWGIAILAMLLISSAPTVTNKYETKTDIPPPAKTNEITAPNPNKQVSRSGMRFIATAYCYGNITKTGTRPQKGRTIAVDPTFIPLGSKVSIYCPEYPEINGVYIAEDTGRLIKDNRIDIYFGAGSEKACFDFGVKEVEVVILE